MKRYIYMIEVQKPTGAHQFIKVLEEILTINGKEINAQNTFGQEIFNDRIENFSYLTETEQKDWPSLLSYFYYLVKTYKESLEYTRDKYVYLIPKEGREPGIRIGHRLPTKLVYDKVKPIPFYPEKDREKEEDTIIDPAIYIDDLDNDLFTDKWYRLFLKKIQELVYYWGCCHSYYYLTFKAFLLIYGQYYLQKKKQDVKYYNLFSYIDTEYMPKIIFENQVYIPTQKTYEIYIKPTFEGEINNGFFYSTKNKNDLINLFVNFCNKTQEWKEIQIG